ncbi:CHAT domain-containing protein [Flavobacterium pectinovorum]|uniref:CHAT domain-containing protein n=1 Tax=Flavobacterium pectinovorum TaxID=29533 RepID=UPI001FAD289D|nr:CHAT domain-containing protein [Flavobacterium pectinovorum]MCI9845283.1 CHAT domain-containing protein [Flavobacterium pectinovorum]
MNLYRLYSLIFFFLNLTVFGQTPEDKIYNAIDIFVAQPSAKALQNLTNTETAFWKNPKPKTKDELLSIVVLNCNKAYYQNQFGQTHHAVSSYEKAWQIYQKHKLNNYDIIEYCLKPLGNLYTVLGDYDSAENMIKQYYYLADTEKNESQKIAAILNLSNVYQNTGRVTEAIDLIEKTIQTEKPTTTQKGLLYNNLGANYLFRSINEDSFNAEMAFLKAIPALKKDKSQTESLYNTYINLYKIYTDYRTEKALIYFEKAKKIFESSSSTEPRKRAKFYLEYIPLLLKKGSLTEAQSILKNIFKILIPNYNNPKNILPKANSLYAETALLDALDFQADIFTLQNQPQKALESYSLSFYIEELFQSLILYENSKIITQIRNRKRTEKCIDIYQSLFKKEGKSIYIKKAFLLTEKSKSVVLKEQLIKNKSGKEKSILEELQKCNTLIIKEQQKEEQADIIKINEAIKKQNELMLLLKKIQSDTKIRYNSAINFNELCTKLEKDNAILTAYFWGTNTVYVFTIQNNQILMKFFCTGQMCGEPIPRFVSLFHKANTITNDIAHYKKTAYLAYKNLLLPAKSNYKNLIIIPDGILNLLPFEALITKESKTSNFAKMHYLLNDFKIAYNNSAAFYLKEIPHSNSKRNVLGIFPIFEKTPYELKFSKDEMQAIKNNFDGKFFENKTASYDNFRKNASNYSILHLSTHASSGDIETPASIKFYDEEILYSQLYNLQLNPDLVVLSACETGIGKWYKGEGAMSVARGFQFAGAQNLLFSLWKVNDYTTSVFMSDFYENIKNNQTYFEANTNAKIDFLNNSEISNDKKSPYYWSSFVYYGSISTETNSANYIWYIISLLTVIGLFLVFNHYRKWKIFTRFSKKRNTKK